MGVSGEYAENETLMMWNGGGERCNNKQQESRAGRYAVIGCKLKQNANEGCNSCASLAGLVLCFIACFILLVIAPLGSLDKPLIMPFRCHVSDVDECRLRTANCDGEDDVCINTRGGYKCQTVTCPRGFVKSPVVGNRSKSV